MRRRAFLALSAAALACRAARAQAPPKLTIGFLSASPLSSIKARTEAFKQGLRDLGYVEGQNITILWRSADDHWERLSALAAELVKLKVAAIVTAEGPAAIATRKASQSVPIVMAQSGDPVAMGIASSLARSGTNVTGLTTLSTDLPGKQVELLKQAVPQLSRIAILSNPANPLTQAAAQHAEVTARKLNLRLQAFSVSAANELPAAFADMVKAQVNGLLVLPDPMLLTQRAQVAELAAKNRLPAIYGIPEHAEAGGMIAYAASRTDLFRRAAAYVDKIAKGAKASDLPIEQPTKFELLVNIKTANALGVTLPQSILVRADKVVE